MPAKPSIRVINMRHFVGAVLVSFIMGNLYSQDISFRRLTTANGLSDNLVNAAKLDKNGVLWVATSEGLNSFDGYAVQNWHTVTGSVFHTRNIREVYCDSLNQVWLMTPEGEVAFLDQMRRCRPVQFEHDIGDKKVSHLILTRTQGMLLLCGNSILKLNSRNGRYVKAAALPDSLVPSSFSHVSFSKDDLFLFSGNDKIIEWDATSLSVKKVFQLPGVTGAVKLPGGDILATTTSDREIFRLSKDDGIIVSNYGLLNDQFGKPVNGFLRNMAIQEDGKIVFASAYAGIYILDIVENKIYNYIHDPLDSRSVSNSRTSGVFAEDNGYVFISTRESGLNYYNTRSGMASLKTYFQDENTGKISGGIIGPIVKNKNGNFWLGCQNRLIEWNRKTHQAWFHEYGFLNGKPLSGREVVSALCFDDQDRIWVGTSRYGIVILDKNGRVLKHLINDSTKTPLPSNNIAQLVNGPDGNIWAATSEGLSIIDPKDFNPGKITLYSPLLQPGKFLVFSLWFRNNSEVWIGTTNGAFRYNLETGKLRVFTTADGLLQNRVSFFGGDSSGNVYMCSRNGLYKVSPDEKVKFYNTANGLKNDICAGVQTDRYNNVWIANDNFLLCFNPATEQFKIFDQSFGITASGFRNGNFYDKDGTLFWGCNDGVTFFQPADLLSRQVPVSISITSLASNDSSFHFTKSETISLGYKQNDLLFTINPVSLSGTTAIIYEYFLEGVNTQWQQGSINRLVSYQNLAPGIYTMKVRSSLDGKNWVNGSNQVLISIAAPWWMQPWFIILCCLIAIAIVYKTWKKQLEEIEFKKEEAETERAIHYFAASMHQHVSVNEILWDITRDCISKLHFEDCVIYLVKPGENLLQQMAAWGPKTKNNNRIVNPLELPMGKGIVGTVAQTGKAEIIGDTTLDKRYVKDDAFRYSEIAVPIIGDGEVLGVIDSEHSRKHFFTAKHLSILTTIASLVGNKIISARAEEKRRNTALELLENQRRTAEVEMQALRAQMNPHFLFNSLNSINNFILKNDPDNASAYLTRFARLMRLILDNSRQDWITLENELNALRLYIEMESLRFNNAFDYNISIHYDVNPEKVLIPPLIIQPYVENAIWHGLLHRSEKGSMLSVGIEKKENYLQVCIRDNGVGREAARKLKSKFAAHKKSHGIQITDERLRIMNAVYEVDARAEIKDETTSEGIAAGTCVILTMKYKSDDLPNY